MKWHWLNLFILCKINIQPTISEFGSLICLFFFRSDDRKDGTIGEDFRNGCR